MSKKIIKKSQKAKKPSPVKKTVIKKEKAFNAKALLQLLLKSKGFLMVREKSRKIAYYFIQFIIRPAEAVDELAKEETGLWTGFWWNAFFYFAYSLIALLYWAIHHPPQQNLFLTIPIENWYLMQAFTTIPAGFAGILSFSGIAYLLSKYLGGKGSFEKTFATQSFAMLIPSFIFMLIPEGLFFPFLFYIHGIQTLPWPKIIELFRVFILPDAWMIFLSVLALNSVHKTGLLKSALVFFISSIPTVIIMAVFIR